MDIQASEPCVEWLDPDRFIDESDWLQPGELPAQQAWGEDVFTSGAAHDRSVDDVDEVTTDLRRLAARQYALFARVLADAADCPDPWCGPDPSLDPSLDPRWVDPRRVDPRWVDPRGRTIAQVRAQRREFAVRAAVADLAVRTRISEVTIRGRAHDADVLRERCPRVWAAFQAGTVDERNAATVASYAATLPADEHGPADEHHSTDDPEQPSVWAVFDAQILTAAQALPAGKFRTRARATRERVHRESIDARHSRARKDRTLWTSNDLDGMATLCVYGPAADIHAAYTRADQAARHLASQDSETRTLAQVRTDVALDLLTRTEPGIGSDRIPVTRTKPAIALTVPVLTLLGEGDEPAILHGYGPIDLDTAKRLAGEATSWVRILTHPVDGTVLDLDRKVYRVPKALARWLGARDPVCAFPGCGRLARDCDIDHRVEWQHGGKTSAGNTGPLCLPHHRVKTETRWRVETDPDSGQVRWYSPSGLVTDTDPPPW